MSCSIRTLCFYDGTNFNADNEGSKGFLIITLNISLI